MIVKWYFILPCLAASPCLAQVDSGTTKKYEHHLSLSPQLNYFFPMDAEPIVENDGFTPEASISKGLAAGYDFRTGSSMFGIEASFMLTEYAFSNQLSIDDYPDILDSLEHYSEKLFIFTPTFQFMANYKHVLWESGRWAVVGRLGIGVERYQPKTIFFSVGRINDDGSETTFSTVLFRFNKTEQYGFNAALGGAVDYGVSKSGNFRVRLEYLYNHSTYTSMRGEYTVLPGTVYEKRGGLSRGNEYMALRLGIVIRL